MATPRLQPTSYGLLEALARLADLPERVSRLEAENTALRAEVAQLKAVAAPTAQHLLTSNQVAERLGLTRRALQERFRRGRLAGEPHPLESLAIVGAEGRRWKARDVDLYVAGGYQ